MTEDVERTTLSGRKCVVIADDDSDMRAWLRRRLRPLDVDICEASTGAELLDVVVTRPGIDLVITDIHMPDLNGGYVTASLRAAGFEMPIIVVSAFANDTVRDIAKGLRAVELLEKPLLTTTFIERIRDALNLDKKHPPSAPGTRTGGSFVARYGG